MDPDIGAEPAGWTAFGVFATLTVVAAARMLIHLPTGRQSMCGAAIGFHAVLLMWTLALTVSSALFVLPWNTSFDNLLLDNAANCFSLTVRPCVGARRRRGNWIAARMSGCTGQLGFAGRAGWPVAYSRRMRHSSIAQTK